MNTIQPSHPYKSVMFFLLMALFACVVYMLFVVVQASSDQLHPVNAAAMVDQVPANAGR